jgi:D-galactarolactone cycloisomerase
VDIDTAFTIADLRGVTVRAPGPDYWRGYGSDSSGAASQRFQFTPPWRTVYARAVESALVRVQLADGSVGWGEATCPIAPEVVTVLLNGFVAEIVRGRPFDSVDALIDLLYDAQRCRGYQAGHLQDAAAALDIALHDALARRARHPLRQVLDADARHTLPCYLSGARAATREERVELLQQWADRGSQAVKLFLRGRLDEDLAELAALREAVPQIGWWAVDALWSYDDADTAARARVGFADLGARWLECPMLPEDLAGHRGLQQAPGCPIALGEHFRTELQVRDWVESGALQVLQPDIGRTGFVMGRRMRQAAQARGIAVTPHMGSSLDVMHAATLNFAAAWADPSLPCEYQAGLAHRLGPALHTRWRLGPSGFEAPDTPGLGVEVDEEALQAFVVA